MVLAVVQSTNNVYLRRKQIPWLMKTNFCRNLNLIILLIASCAVNLFAANAASTPGRQDYRFDVSFGNDNEGYIGKIIVMGYIPGEDGPVLECEHELIQTLDEAPDAVEAKGWVNDTTDLNFDGIPDLQIFLGYYVRGRVSSYYAGYLWDEQNKCFCEISGYDELSNPEIHPESKTITSYDRTGLNELTTWTLAWTDGQLEIINTETSNFFGDE